MDRVLSQPIGQLAPVGFNLCLSCLHSRLRKRPLSVETPHLSIRKMPKEDAIGLVAASLRVIGPRDSRVPDGSDGPSRRLPISTFLCPLLTDRVMFGHKVI